MIRATGTAIGDYSAGLQVLGLPLSTAVTGIVFVGFLIAWRDTILDTQSARTDRAG
ncbi:hypothetical protein [Bradyrhizobium sp. RDM12]